MGWFSVLVIIAMTLAPLVWWQMYRRARFRERLVATLVELDEARDDAAAWRKSSDRYEAVAVRLRFRLLRLGDIDVDQAENEAEVERLRAEVIAFLVGGDCPKIRHVRRQTPDDDEFETPAEAPEAER